MEPSPTRAKKKLLVIAIPIVFFVCGVIAGFFPEEGGAADAISLGGALVTILLAYAWCHYDSLEHDFKIGSTMKIGFVLFFLIAFIVYLFRTRGTKAFWPLGLAVLLFFLSMGVSVLGSFLTLLGRHYLGGTPLPI